MHDTCNEHALGPCVASGYLSCCVEDNCKTSAGCFCDELCYRFQDCCYDITSISCTEGQFYNTYIHWKSVAHKCTVMLVVTLPQVLLEVTLTFSLPISMPSGVSTLMEVHCKQLLLEKMRLQSLEWTIITGITTFILFRGGSRIFRRGGLRMQRK